MKKFNNILKNTIIFLSIFLVINFIMQSCQGPEEELLFGTDEIVFTTTKPQYSRYQTVTVQIKNNSKEDITIPNECPKEPFNVYRYQNGEWVQKSVSPDLSCEDAEDIIIPSGQEISIPYDKWNYALFSEMGRFKIEFETTTRGETAEEDTEEDDTEETTEEDTEEDTEETAEEDTGETTEEDTEETAEEDTEEDEVKTYTSNEFIIVKEGLIRQLSIGLFYRPIYNGLIFLTYIIPNNSLGWAIILLTLIIRTILLVPSHKAMKSQKRMQEIQPKLEKIKQQYKGDQQRIAAETMAVWKEAKINPMGSCLPTLMQLPFLIALFYAIQQGLNPDKTYLLYVEYANFGLQDINVNFLGVLNLMQNNRYVLPLIVGGLQFIQMYIMMGKTPKKKSKNKSGDPAPNPTKMMLYIMPVMIAVFTSSLPAGVGIYWGTSTLYGIFQQYFVNKGKNKTPNEPKVKVIKS